METLKKYDIDLKSLSISTIYELEYELNDEFFDSVDATEVKQGNVRVVLKITRAALAFELNFRIMGKVIVTCDRCLEDVELPVEASNRLIVTFGDEFAETSDEHVIVSEDVGKINVAWYMYEFVVLALPIKRVHESGGCNELMAAKLRELSVEECEYGDDEGERNRGVTDPRWDALRNLIEDN
ncbi:MAG: DUF177 domain-containing protein [Tannerella sp.]|nr:DUF177 domain-containing protein [Tannerella sp.]